MTPPAWLRALRPRPLSLACAVMAVLLVVKTREVVQAVGGAPAALLSASRAMVSAAHAAAPAPAQPAPAHPAPVQPGHEASKEAPKVVPAAPAAAALPPADPPVSDSERALLLDLRARRTQMEAQEGLLSTRETVLAAAEKRMAERVEQLSALQVRLEALDGTRRERDDANWRGLVKTYETMRPRDAAAILNDMDLPVLLQVLDRMKEAKAAPVLAAMLPDRARSATAGLAAMRTRSTAPPDALPATPPAAPLAAPSVAPSVAPSGKSAAGTPG